MGLVVKLTLDNHLHPISLNRLQFVAGYDFGHINAARNIEASCCKSDSLGVVAGRAGDNPFCFFFSAEGGNFVICAA